MLADQSWHFASSRSAGLDALDAIRQALTGYSHLLAAGTPVWPLPQLRAAVVEAHRVYQAAEYERTARMLPDILTALDGYEDVSPQVQVVRCEAYVVAAKLLTKVAETNLAWLCADRAATAAVASESLGAQGLAAYQVVCALLRGERIEDAERVAVTSAERLTARGRASDPALVSSAGALWLIGAIVAARRVDRPAVKAQLGQAKDLAGILAHDGNHGWTAFGPTNVAIHRAAAAAEMGDPHEVLNGASLVDPSTLPKGLNGRRADLHVHLAWAQVQRRHDPEAVLHLLEVERIAPEILRYHIVPRALVRQMLKRERRNRTPALRQIAMRAGILT